MAQLGARFHGMEEVIGSIPIRSTNKPQQCSDLRLAGTSTEGPEGSKSLSCLQNLSGHHELDDIFVRLALERRNAVGIDVHGRFTVRVSQ